MPMKDGRLAPPVLPSDLRMRRWIVAAFWATILVGLPLWWKTTLLERRPLPEGRIRNWAESWQARISPALEPSTDEIDPRAVKYSPHYKLVFSLLNQDSSAGGSIASWDAQELLNRHVRPLLESLAPLHNFTIESQVQYFAPLAAPIHREEDNSGAYVDERDLRAFVNNAEWNLASGDVLDPVLHLLLYVPSPENRPLKIRNADGAETVPAFLTPQRGGLVIFNPPAPAETLPSFPLSLPSEAFAQSFRLFASQLRILLGLPSSSSPELETLIRRRLREAVHDSVDTLEALVKLTAQIPNMRISKEIQARTGAALDALDAAAMALATSPAAALHHAGRAQRLAAQAYFDPSMLALLYFPEEHKYAVYTPLFGPVAVPLLVALLREVKEWRAERRKKIPSKDGSQTNDAPANPSLGGETIHHAT